MKLTSVDLRPIALSEESRRSSASESVSSCQKSRGFWVGEIGGAAFLRTIKLQKIQQGDRAYKKLRWLIRYLGAPVDLWPSLESCHP
jgi:hypothetical protein